MYIMNSPDSVTLGVFDFISRIPAHTNEQFGSSILPLMNFGRPLEHCIFKYSLFWRETARRLGGIVKLIYMCPKT